MGNLFGVRRRGPRVTEQDKAILQLKQQRDKIKIYQKRTESELAKNKELAAKLYNDKKIDRALIVLRRKKLMEETLSRTDQQLETLEGLVSDIEFSQIQVSVAEGLKIGNEALKQLNSLISIEELEKIVQENEEGAEKQREISTILQGTLERYDEQELMDELETYKIHEDKETIKTEEPKEKDKVSDDNKDEPVLLEAINHEEVDEKKEEEKQDLVQIEEEPFVLPDLPDVPTEVPIIEKSEPEKIDEEGKSVNEKVLLPAS